ncbi:hypothetical protein BpHYR1_007420 [Brachionus plicatilis]|uniref:Uncharacterized protein n=1 Tax=Brachionus plicatilis TaxID=10195 RepID=A0A3M7SLZ4_BRAPC|nr:hypothetical protein BpHYR1_007420 [Brachionus plicatilis]
MTIVQIPDLHLTCDLRKKKLFSTRKKKERLKNTQRTPFFFSIFNATERLNHLSHFNHELSSSSTQLNK